MEIKRDLLLKRLMDLRHNGMIKVVTGTIGCRSGGEFTSCSIISNYFNTVG